MSKCATDSWKLRDHSLIFKCSWQGSSVCVLTALTYAILHCKWRYEAGKAAQNTRHILTQSQHNWIFFPKSVCCRELRLKTAALKGIVFVVNRTMCFETSVIRNLKPLTRNIEAFQTTYATDIYLSLLQHTGVCGNSLPYSVEFRNECCYTSTPLYVFMSCQKTTSNVPLHGIFKNVPGQKQTKPQCSKWAGASPRHTRVFPLSVWAPDKVWGNARGASQTVADYAPVGKSARLLKLPTQILRYVQKFFKNLLRVLSARGEGIPFQKQYLRRSGGEYIGI